jgi:hypothetical protein
LPKKTGSGQNVLFLHFKAIKTMAARRGVSDEVQCLSPERGAQKGMPTLQLGGGNFIKDNSKKLMNR